MSEDAKPFEMRPEESGWTVYPSGPTGGPALTFRPEEWRMVGKVSGPVRVVPWHDVVSEAMTELDREDALMSAVRAVARGG